MYSGQVSVTKCSSPPDGYLQIVSMQNVSIIFHEPVSRSQACLTHINYVQDTFYYKTVGCSYKVYIEKIIDKLSASQVTVDDDTGEYHQYDNILVDAVLKCEHASFSNAFPHLDFVYDPVASDFFDSNKKLQFLALEGSQFKFIGLDRDSPPPLSLSDYILMTTVFHSFCSSMAFLFIDKLGSQFIPI